VREVAISVGVGYAATAAVVCAGLRCAVQGLVTLLDADAATGGLCVVPGSHKWHDDVVQDAPYSHDFVMVPPHWPGFTALPRRRLVHARAGDLVLW